MTETRPLTEDFYRAPSGEWVYRWSDDRLVLQSNRPADAIEIVVLGSPAPQGSKSPKGRTKEGRTIMVESSKKVKPWRDDVRAAAIEVMAGRPPLDGALRARAVFTLKKPVSAPKTRVTYPDRYPDVSKLIRSTEDALTSAGVWADDARVVEYVRLAKVFPGEDPEALHVPGVRLTIWRIADEPHG